jgi:ankyrin repeat protein
MLRNSLLTGLCLAGVILAGDMDPRLADAAQRGDQAAVRALLQQKANVNAAQGDGMTALHWAASNGDVEMARILITAKPDLEAVTRLSAMTPLYLAATKGNAQVVDILLQAGANANTASDTGATALMAAAASGSARAVEALIAKGADVNAKDKPHGQTPLMFAAAENRAEVIHVLIKHGAKAEAATRTGDPGCGSVFDRDSCAAGADDGQAPRNAPHQDKLQELVEPKPAPSVAVEGGDGKPPAPKKESSEAKEDSPKLSPEEAARTAQMAELRGELKKLEGMLDALDKKTSTNTEGRKRRGSTVIGGMTALLFAAREGHLEAAQALVEEGADVNGVGQGEKLSPLVMAIVNDHFDLAKYLLDKNADPNLANIEGLTALYATIDSQWAPYAWRPQPISAAEHTSYLALMRELLEHGANPNARLTQRVWFRALPGDRTWVDQSGATAFWRAAQATDLPAMRLLVNAGADPKLPTYEGVTPLMMAAGLGWAPNFTRNAADAWTDAVKYCLELGLDINAKAANGYTAVHGTAFIGNDDLVKFMVSKGADLTGVTKDKDTVADMANGPFPHSLVHPETAALLEEMGSKNSHNCRADTCLIAPDAAPKKGKKKDDAVPAPATSSKATEPAPVIEAGHSRFHFPSGTGRNFLLIFVTTV